MMGSASNVNVANFVSVRPSLLDKGTVNFSIWKEQMLCLLGSQDVTGFVDGGIVQPPDSDDELQKAWRRTDTLVRGWILGSIGKDALDDVWKKPTARDVWLKLENIFSQKEAAPPVERKSSEDFSRYLALYQAALRGDWDTAIGFFQDVSELSTAIISSNSETALHIAVSTGKENNDFVNKLVEMTPPDKLAGSRDYHGDTALHIAAFVGNTEAAMALVNRNPDLLYTFNHTDRLPVQQAATSCQKETLNYLICKHETNHNADHNPFQGQLGLRLLIATITSQFLDVALDLARKYPDLALLSVNDTSQKMKRRRRQGISALSTVAESETLFPRTEYFSWWRKLVYHRIPIIKSKCEAAQRTGDIENSLSSNGAANNNYTTSFQIISGVGQKVELMMWNAMEHLAPQVKEMREKKARHEEALKLADHLCRTLVSFPENGAASTIFRRSIMRAVKYGISEIVEIIIHNYPEAVFHRDDVTGMTVFHLAASNRFESVTNLMYNMSDRKHLFFDLTDKQGNNLMHTCGYLAPPKRLNLVAGAALQMQRELQWFKEMENFVNPSRRLWNNNAYQTPQLLFTKEHEKLKADGERWMKDTANACTIAAALIATVVFAAAFTVPGGVESATGNPLFSGEPAFVLFGVSDAVSLFTSITSLLMFLSILTSRYAEEDFLYLLPNRLTLGLLSLFVSITFMMVAFSATLYLVFRQKAPWLLIPVAAFACLPVTSFVLLQFPLLVDVLFSTYGPGIFHSKTFNNKRKTTTTI